MSEKDKSKGTDTSQPTDWGVEDVNSWLKTSGFDDDICDRFKGKLLPLIQQWLDVAMHRQ
jgi:hypothetical protein